ncbi:Ubiquitin-like modifier-activating enzyme 1 [Tritrichomonas foetus]|uniref:E1 ubiquitin-activating enzyme n=1 Tax=Tritrichomonas foetus TaxID=1144522 RepID=A0A1J4JJM5_9EUKA|nr:Ubiquitin-like modifier-activating enzyme 1 [Tritrichomonas foetus]|eukprot:OHS99360.1 Ubiquitin-like modifier-activating enzyme 1 [Tritrichomonas foetus]
MSQPTETSEPVVDENLYSRQIYVLGLDAMKKLASSSVLISGLGGLGVEIAKNVILAGVKNVTVHDRRNATIRDLASNFYLSEKSVGKNRALESLSQLSGLNDYVTVTAKTDELTNDFLKNYQCVVLTDHHKESEINRISQFCHKNNIKLIIAETRGVFGYIFDDFGHEFIVTDPTGEQPSRFLLSFITNSKEGIVTIADGESHELGEGDHVRFEEVEGMTELNGKDFPVKVINSRQFSIGDTSNFGKYTSAHRSGYGNQVVLPVKIDFYEFTEALSHHVKTMELPFDYCCFGRDKQVVLAFVAAQHYMETANTDSAEVSGDDLIKAAKEINGKYKIVEEIDEALLREFARESGAVISPTCAAFGGIAGQEVIKAVSSKFSPLNQFLAMGYIESIPSDHEYTLKNDRYDPYRIVFGNKQQEVMQNLRYFMIGAGALGCEQLKNWALMGVATHGDGKVYITDMDSIERSNLNRQFLFRSSDIGKMKSDAAAQAACVMNPEFKIESHQNRIGPESAHIYNDVFYDKLSGVCNALDNVQTRLFSDQMCVFYNRPLLESGTLGPKAHFQIVVPHLTESYGSQPDPPEKGIPMCTLHNFPSCIDHTCMWARDQFGGLFEQQPQSVNALLKELDYIKKMTQSDQGALLMTLQAAKAFFITEKCENFDDCVRWARLKFEEYFNYKIRDLQHQFPEDAISPEGVPFWTGAKRYPSPATFDPSNPYHAEFVTAAATLRARVCGIKPEADIPARAAKVNVPEWKPSGSKINLEENENSNASSQPADDSDIDQLIQQVQPFVGKHALLHPEEFEKDDDSNGHMDFVAAAANIRAINYQIEPQEKLEIKRIAGKIIPAIATTTAMICGLVALEMYKVHSIDEEKRKKLETYRFGSINLAIPIFNISEPLECHVKECPANGIKYSLWDKWIIEGDITLGEFFKKVQEKYKVEVDMVTVGRTVMYPVFSDMKKGQMRLQTKITDILTKELNVPPLVDGQCYIPIEALCVDENGDDVDTPPFVLKVK